MKVLLTGAAGFIGYHSARRLLDRGDEVLGVDNLNDYYPVALKQDRLAQLNGRNGFRFLKLDVARRDSVDALAAEAAETILFLVSPQNTVTSGAVLPLYGKA